MNTLNPTSGKLLYTAYIQSNIDYTFTLWDSSSDTSIRPRGSDQRKAIRWVSLKPSVDSRFLVARVLLLLTRPKFNKCMLVSKILTVKMPPKFCNIFSINIPRIDLNWGTEIVWHCFFEQPFFPQILKKKKHTHQNLVCTNWVDSYNIFPNPLSIYRGFLTVLIMYYRHRQKKHVPHALALPPKNKQLPKTVNSDKLSTAIFVYVIISLYDFHALFWITCNAFICSTCPRFRCKKTQFLVILLSS